MSAPHDSPVSPAATAAPQAALRTVLLADLGPVDPDALQAARDAAVRELLAASGGRLIDQAEGLLALFERTVQAVDFALRLQDQCPSARAGIHVGEVVTWSNPPEAVMRGAKPLEVEGLAKPVAARLLGLAMPGQILLSGLAQSLARQAQAELGETSSSLRWRTYGRYRFKGVATALVVHEVGLRGRAPLQAPPSSEKAWREVPLWRRPPVLALELLGTAALVIGVGYGVLHSQPALSFGARDWVVVGDFRNLTGDARLGEALDTALRVSLEQSRYVNLLPELKVESALARMQRPATTPVDRAVGSEVALREGARAVLLPSVTRAGDRWRVNVEVVDPGNGVTVYAESAEGTGAASTLTSLDHVNAALRARLGEALPDIAANGRPLAKVTTGSLEALREYSRAFELARHSDLAAAATALRAAVRFDPAFAMAHVGLAQFYLNDSDSAAARREMQMAVSSPERLSNRERLHVQALQATYFGRPAEAVSQWKALLALYPDQFGARFGAAEAMLYFLQDYAGTAAILAPARVPQNPREASAWYMTGTAYLALDRLEDAEKAFHEFDARGGAGYRRDIGDLYAVQRRFAEARKALSARSVTGNAGLDLDMRLPEATYPLDEGHWRTGIDALHQLQRDAGTGHPESGRAYQVALTSLSAMARGASALPDVRQLLARETANALDNANPSPVLALAAALHGCAWLARLGSADDAQRTVAHLRARVEETGSPALDDLVAIADAEILMRRGRAGEAVKTLQSRISGRELYLVHEGLARALRADHAEAPALREVAWLIAHRGRGYAEWVSQSMFQPTNVVVSDLAWLDAAELECELRQPARARESLEEFRRIWPSPPAFAAARLARLERRLAAKHPDAMAVASRPLR